MRKHLLPLSLIAGTLCLTNLIKAQQADRFTFVVTDEKQQGSAWNYLRKLNLTTGEYSAVILAGNDINLQAYDAATRKPLAAPLNDTRYGNYVNAAFATGVAAVAYDRKSNRLFFTPMLYDQLRYLDLKTGKVYFVTDQVFTGKSQKSSTQGDIVTRMAIASDGKGYAITNDGTQLIQFSTGKNVQITDLGSLVDDPANQGLSIHNSCSSFGGDMIADDDGNLYVFSARNNVFKVNIESKVATYLGVISNLPNGFTVNGAVVTDENKILVASAVQGGSWFLLDTKTWAATPYKQNNNVWQSSDLANSNLLITKPQPVDIVSRVAPLTNPVSDKVIIYPNPVTENQFTIQFNELQAGTYKVQVTDVTGRTVVQQSVVVAYERQTETIKLAGITGKGTYLVKVTDAGSRSVFDSKIVVQ
jgi:hypothetical protein